MFYHIHTCMYKMKGWEHHSTCWYLDFTLFSNLLASFVSSHPKTQSKALRTSIIYSFSRSTKESMQALCRTHLLTSNGKTFQVNKNRSSRKLSPANHRSKHVHTHNTLRQAFNLIQTLIMTKNQRNLNFQRWWQKKVNNLLWYLNQVSYQTLMNKRKILAPNFKWMTSLENLRLTEEKIL